MQGIQSALLDLIKEYKYVYDSQRNEILLDFNKIDTIHNLDLSESFEYNNRRFQNYSKTYATIVDIFNGKNTSKSADSIKDEILSNIARFITGNGDFPHKILENYITSLPQKSVIKERLLALNYMFCGRYEDAITLLTILKDRILASYCKDDVLIDLRNLTAYKNNSLGVMDDLKIQEEIIKSKRFISAPILDRIKNNIFKKLDQERIAQLYQYYSFRASNNLLDVVEQVASYLIVAFETGSITHIKLTDDLIFNVLFYLQENEMAFDNNLLVKMALLSGKYKQLTLIENNFSDYYFVKDDVIKLFNLDIFFVDEYKRNVYKCNVLKHFYYYLDEKEFLEKYKEILSIYKTNKNGFLDNLLQETILSSLKRIAASEIETLIIWLVENGRIIILQKFFEKIQVQSCNFDDQFLLNLMEQVKEIQENWPEDSRDELCSFLEKIALTRKKHVKRIGFFIEQFNPIFYEKFYSVNIFKTLSVDELVRQRLESIISISDSREANRYVGYSENNQSSLYKWFFYKKFRRFIKQSTYIDVLNMVERVLANKLSAYSDRETALITFVCAYVFTKSDNHDLFSELAKRIIKNKENILEAHKHFGNDDDHQLETIISFIETIHNKNCIQFSLFIAMVKNNNKKMRNTLLVTRSLVLLVNDTNYRKIFNDSCYFQLLVGLVGIKDKLSLSYVIECFKVLTKTEYEDRFDDIFSKIYDSSYEVKREIVEIAKNYKEKYPITFSKIELDQDYRIREIIV